MELDPLASPFDTQEGDIFALEQPSIDLNRQIATNEYGGALKYSELSPEDQAVVLTFAYWYLDINPHQQG